MGEINNVLVLFAACFVPLSYQLIPEINMCPSADTAMPRQLELDERPLDYAMVEHGMQLFLDYIIPVMSKLFFL